MTSELPGQDALVPEMKCDSIKMCDLWKEPTWFLEYVALDLFVGNKVMRTRFRPYDVSLKSKTQWKATPVLTRLLVSLCAFGLKALTAPCSFLCYLCAFPIWAPVQSFLSAVFRLHTFPHRNNCCRASWMMDKNWSNPNVAEIVCIRNYTQQEELETSIRNTPF